MDLLKYYIKSSLLHSCIHCMWYCIDCYNKGENTFIKIFNNDQKLRAATETFMVEEDSEKVLFNEGINWNVWCQKFEWSAIQTFHRTRALPPTEDAAKEHIKRIYLQIQRSKNNALIPAEEWRWQTNSSLKLIKMMQPAAPKNVILKIIFRSCITACALAYGCSGLHCSTPCIICTWRK